MPVERRSRRAGGRRRTTVLESPALILAERGYENTRFADVSKAGVAISTLQNYFGSREDMLIEFCRSGVRDAELRAYGEEGWTRYRAPFVTTVVEGRDAGDFTFAADPGDVVDLLLAALTGAMIPRVLDFSAPSAAGFRKALLRQTATMLGRADTE